MYSEFHPVQTYRNDERIFGRRPFGFGRPFGFNPFLGGVVGGLLGSALVGPYGFGYGYPYYPYPYVYGYPYPFY